MQDCTCLAEGKFKYSRTFWRGVAEVEDNSTVIRGGKYFDRDFLAIVMDLQGQSALLNYGVYRGR
jgi:hypothetical protein